MRERFYAGNLLRYTLDKKKKKLLLYWKKNKEYGQYNFWSPYSYYFCLDLNSKAPTFIIHTESWINSVNYYIVGPILTEAKDTFITYYLILYISSPSPLSMQWLCFSHSTFPSPFSNNKTNFALHDSNSCCSLYSNICLFVFYFFFYHLSRVNFLLYFSFSISPHPVISPSNRKIQSHFRQHASLPSLTSPRWLTSLSGWFPAGRGGRGEGAIFYLMFEYDCLFIPFSIRGCFMYEVVMKWKWVPISGLLCQESVVERTSLQELPMSSII